MKVRTSWCGVQVVISEDVHRSVFRAPPKPRTIEEMKEGVRRHVKKRRAIR
jgi:hypothetical protein